MEKNNSQFNKIAIFQKKEIRKTIHNNEWWFVIEDVVLSLINSKNPRGYIKDMRRRDAELAKGWVQIATPLSIKTAGGAQKINCASGDSSREEKQYPVGRELSSGFHPETIGGLI